MTGHTPGPWEQAVSAEGPQEISHSVWAGSCWRVHVADVGISEKANSEVEANARLIAAAPDLLHACRLIAENAPAIADWLTDNDPAALLQVRAAIAKATGGAVTAYESGQSTPTTAFNPLDHINTPKELEAYVQERLAAPSAPQMLDALEVVRMSRGWHDMSAQLQTLITDAIASATGEGA